MNCHLAITRVKFVYLIDACVLRRKLNRRFHNKRRRREGDQMTLHRKESSSQKTLNFKNQDTFVKKIVTTQEKDERCLHKYLQMERKLPLNSFLRVTGKRPPTPTCSTNGQSNDLID